MRTEMQKLQCSQKIPPEVVCWRKRQVKCYILFSNNVYHGSMLIIYLIIIIFFYLLFFATQICFTLIKITNDI